MRRFAGSGGSETAGKNGPGYKSATHGDRSDILAEGEGFVSDGLR